MLAQSLKVDDLDAVRHDGFEHGVKVPWPPAG